MEDFTFPVNCFRKQAPTTQSFPVINLNNKSANRTKTRSEIFGTPFYTGSAAEEFPTKMLACRHEILSQGLKLPRQQYY
jgi:hypothetical protein